MAATEVQCKVCGDLLDPERIGDSRKPYWHVANAARTKGGHCDDLYAEAEQSPTHVLLRKSTPVKNIQTELAEILSLLDRHEKYFFSKGGMSILVMLCARTDMASQTSQNLDAIRTGLRNKRLESFAAGYLENLRQDARIIKK